MNLQTQLTPQSAIQILRMYEEFILESRFSHEEFDSDKTWELLRATLDRPKEYFITYLEKEDEVIGFLTVMMTKKFFTKPTYAVDAGMYLKPEWRGKKLAHLLVEKAEKWAKENGSKTLCLGISSGINVKTIAEVYAGFGYEKVCLTFEKGL